jgi:hypothetical protein
LLAFIFRVFVLLVVEHETIPPSTASNPRAIILFICFFPSKKKPAAKTLVLFFAAGKPN